MNLRSQLYLCAQCNLEFSLRRKRRCRGCGALLLIPYDASSDSELTAFRSFWMWDPGKERWRYIEDWDDHKRQAMRKFEAHLISKEPGTLIM